MRRDRGSNELSVGVETRVGAVPKTQILLVIAEKRVVHPERMVMKARPGIVAGIVHDARSYRIELDVAMALEQVALRIDQARTKAPLPQGPTVLPHSVEAPHEASPYRLHHS